MDRSPMFSLDCATSSQLSCQIFYVSCKAVTPHISTPLTASRLRVTITVYIRFPYILRSLSSLLYLSNHDVVHLSRVYMSQVSCRTAGLHFFLRFLLMLPKGRERVVDFIEVRLSFSRFLYPAFPVYVLFRSRSSLVLDSRHRHAHHVPPSLVSHLARLISRPALSRSRLMIAHHVQTHQKFLRTSCNVQSRHRLS